MSRLRVAVALLSLFAALLIDWQSYAVLAGPLNLPWSTLSATNLWPLEGQCEISKEIDGFVDVRAILGSGALIQQKRIDGTPSAWVVTSASAITDISGNLVVADPSQLQLRFVGSDSAIYTAKKIVIHPTVKGLAQVAYLGKEGKYDLALIEVDIYNPDGSVNQAKRPRYPSDYDYGPLRGLLILDPDSGLTSLKPTGGMPYAGVPSDGMNFRLSAFGEKGTVNGVDGTFPNERTVDIGDNNPPAGCPPLNIIEGLSPTFVQWTFHDRTPTNCSFDNNFSRRDKGGLVTQKTRLTDTPRPTPAGVAVGPLLAIASGSSKFNSAQGDVPYCSRLDTVSFWIQTHLDPTSFPPPGVEPRPDLTIPGVSAVSLTPTLSSDPLRIVAGADVDVTVQYQNLVQPHPLRLTDANNQFLISVYLNETGHIGSSGGAAGSAAAGPLLAGDSGSVTIRINYPNPGKYTMAIAIDPDKAVLESNDLNNVVYIPLTVVARGSDLQIPNVQRFDPNPGIQHSFVVTIENLGLTESAASSIGFYTNRALAPTNADSPDQVIDVPVLPALGTTTVTFFLPQQDVARAGTAWFLADQSGVVAEDIEGNNTASSVWGVANSAPAVSSPVSASKTLISTGETITFSIGVSDPEADPLSYFWEFGDGTFELGGPTVSHTYTTAGLFTVKVTAKDGPFNQIEQQLNIEVVTDIINLGTISKTTKRLRFKLALPAGFTKKKLRTTLVNGNPGPGVRYRNLQICGKTPTTPGEYSFGIEFMQAASKSTPARLQRFLYRYNVQ